MNKRQYHTVITTIRGILLGSIILGMLMMASYVETRYTREGCEIICVEDDVVTVEDTCGYTWQYEVEDDAPRVGETVNLHMHTNNTDSIIEDDLVLRVVAQ